MEKKNEILIHIPVDFKLRREEEEKKTSGLPSESGRASLPKRPLPSAQLARQYQPGPTPLSL